MNSGLQAREVWAEFRTRPNPFFENTRPLRTGFPDGGGMKLDFEKAARLDSAVFLRLRRMHQNICYYKTEQQKKEVAFVATTPTGNLPLLLNFGFGAVLS